MASLTETQPFGHRRLMPWRCATGRLLGAARMVGAIGEKVVDVRGGCEARYSYARESVSCK